jgi:hypothetical protein
VRVVIHNELAERREVALHAASSGAIVGASSSDDTMILFSFKCAKAASPEPGVDLVNRRADEQPFPGLASVLLLG